MTGLVRFPFYSVNWYNGRWQSAHIAKVLKEFSKHKEMIGLIKTNLMIQNLMKCHAAMGKVGQRL